MDLPGFRKFKFERDGGEHRFNGKGAEPFGCKLL